MSSESAAANREDQLLIKITDAVESGRENANDCASRVNFKTELGGGARDDGVNRPPDAACSGATGSRSPPFSTRPGALFGNHRIDTVQRITVTG